MVGLGRQHLLLSGNKLKFMTNFSRKGLLLCNMVEYEIPNLLGTFLHCRVRRWARFGNSTLNMGQVRA